MIEGNYIERGLEKVNPEIAENLRLLFGSGVLAYAIDGVDLVLQEDIAELDSNAEEFKQNYDELQAHRRAWQEIKDFAAYHERGKKED